MAVDASIIKSEYEKLAPEVQKDFDSTFQEFTVAIKYGNTPNAMAKADHLSALGGKGSAIGDYFKDAYTRISEDKYSEAAVIKDKFGKEADLRANERAGQGKARFEAILSEDLLKSSSNEQVTPPVAEAAPTAPAEPTVTPAPEATSAPAAPAAQGPADVIITGADGKTQELRFEDGAPAATTEATETLPPEETEAPTPPAANSETSAANGEEERAEDFRVPGDEAPAQSEERAEDFRVPGDEEPNQSGERPEDFVAQERGQAQAEAEAGIESERAEDFVVQERGGEEPTQDSGTERPEDFEVQSNGTTTEEAAPTAPQAEAPISGKEQQDIVNNNVTEPAAEVESKKPENTPAPTVDPNAIVINEVDAMKIAADLNDGKAASDKDALGKLGVQTKDGAYTDKDFSKTIASRASGGFTQSELDEIRGMATEDKNNNGKSDHIKDSTKGQDYKQEISLDDVKAPTVSAAQPEQAVQANAR